MLSRLSHTLRGHALCAPDDHVVVAVSGGPDSLALLHGLAHLAPRLGLRLSVATVDHGLRAEAGLECEDVVAHAKGMGIVGTILRVDVASSRGPHRSVQEAARDVRLAALEAHAQAVGAASVALGHTMDDQAETILFRILRGTGVAGLAGIPYRRGHFIRPLLDIRRAEILAFLAKRKIPYITDPSNANPRYARARIRHEILPFLAKENPKIVEALLALSRSSMGEGGNAPGVPKDLPLSRGAREAIVRFQREAKGTRSVDVVGGSVRCSYGHLQFVPRTSVAARSMGMGELLVPGMGTYRLDEVTGVTLRVVPPNTTHAYDADALRWPLVLRTARPGDRLRPRGGVGRRKLSDAFIDAKIPREDRASLPILCDGSGEILYVPRTRPSELGRPNPLSRNLFVVEEAR